MMGLASDIHVLPENDLRVHQETRECWCRPRCTFSDVGFVGVDDDAAVVVVHNSADGRELVEQHGVN